MRDVTDEELAAIEAKASRCFRCRNTGLVGMHQCSACAGTSAHIPALLAEIRRLSDDARAAHDIVRCQLLAHPLPWTVERDWTWEVTARDGAIVAKCMTPEDAGAVVAMAERIRADLDVGAAEIEAEIAAGDAP